MELLSTHFFFDQPSISDIYAMRKMLEPEVAALVAGRVTREELIALENTIRIYDHPPADLDEQYRQRVAELDFHSMLAQLCQIRFSASSAAHAQSAARNSRLHGRSMPPDVAFREKRASFQYRLMAALKDGRSEDARAIAAEHMASPKATWLEGSGPSDAHGGTVGSWGIGFS